MQRSFSQDIELGVVREAWRDGYAAVAAFIARDPDNETFIYRKFDQLSARNLLYLQSELIDLEKRLEEYDRETAKSGDMELKQSARKWETFTKNAIIQDEERKRMELVKDIRAKVKEYHEALLLQSQVMKLDSPSDRAFKAFRNWFKGKAQEPSRPNSDFDPVLGGRAKTLLDDKQDLAALKTPVDKDWLSRFLQDHWPVGSGKSELQNLQVGHFLERHVIWTVAIIDTIVAAILLIGAITSLYFVTRPAARLGMISGFTVTFAAGVGALTNARRAEMFAATAAYAAVLVVFVSGGLANTNT